jgi:YD repeat-containing protein
MSERGLRKVLVYCCTVAVVCSTIAPAVPAALLALAITTDAASAQQRTFYDARGNVVGRSATDSQGTVTTYDPRGNVVARESTTGSTTTVYDARGRNIGRLTTNR